MSFKLIEDPVIHAALTLAASGDLDGAERLLQDHLAHHPRAFTAYIGLGQIYRCRGRRDLALSVLARALELKPDHQTLPCEVALELFELGRWSEALAIWEEKTQGSNLPRKALQDYANALLRIGRLEEAEQRFNALIECPSPLLARLCGIAPSCATAVCLAGRVALFRDTPLSQSRVALAELSSR